MLDPAVMIAEHMPLPTTTNDGDHSPFCSCNRCLWEDLEDTDEVDLEHGLHNWQLV